MTFLGYKKQKGKIKYFSPTPLQPSSFILYNTSNYIYVVGTQPIFNLSFSVIYGSEIASGYSILIRDKDTSVDYPILNQTIVLLFKKIQLGEISIIDNKFNYDLDRTCNQIRPFYTFDVSCQGSVPEAIICFLESDSYEDCIRLAISLGGDSDTLAAMAGGIAEAYYKEIPSIIKDKVFETIPQEFEDILSDFKLYTSDI